MNKEEIVNKNYSEAVKDLDNEMLKDKDLWYSYIINLPIELQSAYTIFTFQNQVLNGGLHQYFFNPYGQFAYLTIDNLELVGAFRTADILKRALTEVNAENYSLNQFRDMIFSRKHKRIVDFDDELADFLEKLDDEYYALNEDLVELYVDNFEGRK